MIKSGFKKLYKNINWVYFIVYALVIIILLNIGINTLLAIGAAIIAAIWAEDRYVKLGKK